MSTGEGPGRARRGAALGRLRLVGCRAQPAVGRRDGEAVDDRGSDAVARGVADGLRDNGRRVPDDIALVGVDNWLPTAEGCRPALTSVDLNLQQVGRTAAELLLQAIQQGTTQPGAHTVPCRLVVRASSAPAGG
ncbi:substrate-binding domain-containing protein [Phytohabitans houttuyneae]|uniref:substrate-binding domain-containing protein n=1 Tax=Phytohabitans houttuyneae TaxID=1076126 RepID=UPI0015674937|nr:substrate-binding domain-containing protein [Phytohabitans houttuyneae]